LHENSLHARSINGILLLITLLSCNNRDTEIWDGYYINVADNTSFFPCGLDSLGESWYVTGEDKQLVEFLSKYHEISNTGCEVYVQIKGTKSKKGLYGNNGSSIREFNLTEILEVRCRKKDDCECDCE